MSYGIPLLLFAFVKDKKKILFAMTFLSNTTEKYKNEGSVNIVYFFRLMRGSGTCLLLLENLNRNRYM